MPHIDFESLVPRCGGDRKVVCESTLKDPDSDYNPEYPSNISSDFPPESFWLSNDAEFDWFNNHNVFLDRKDSTKGNNPSASNPSSQRFLTNLVSKASIISLPMKPKSGYVEGLKKRQPKTRKTHLPKPNELALKSVVEPASPMVSCMGRVRSRGRRRRTESTETPDARPVGKVRRKESRWIGLYKRFMKNFFSHLMIKSEVASAQPSIRGVRVLSNGTEAEGEPDGFRGLTRFSSVRRTVSWGRDDFDDLTWHS